MSRSTNDHLPTNPRISVFMVDGGFRERFHTLDCLGRQTLSPDEYEVMWIEHFSQIHPRLAETASRYANTTIVTLDRDASYHAGYCRNEGLRRSRGDLVVYLDADVVVEEDFLERIAAEHAKCDDLVMHLYRYDEPESQRRADWDIEHLRRVGRLENPLNYGACISVRRRWLIDVNGWEQHPVLGSHFNAHATDLHARLRARGLAVKWHPDIPMYHPWHPLNNAPADAYALQALFVNWRTNRREVLPFSGLDERRNRPAPAELDEWLAQEARYLARRRYGWPGRALNRIEKLLRR
jgi:glycosyltransferase involved in cell wall biosynthesis